MPCDTFLDSGRVFGYNPQMKTQMIEIDDDTAMALKQRAAERGLSVPELLAELVTLEAGPVDTDLDRFVEFLGRERPSLAKIVATEIIDKVQVLSEHPQLGRPIAGRQEYRQIVLQVLGAAYVFQYRFDGRRLVMLRVYHARESRK